MNEPDTSAESVSQFPMLTRAALACSIAAFLVALPCDSFCIDGDCTRWPSYGLLLLGWMQVLATPDSGPFAGLAWLANPAIMATWILVLRHREPWLARATAIGAVLLAAGFLVAHAVVADEAGNRGSITGYRVGYWLWLTSALTALLATFRVSIKSTPINPFARQIVEEGKVDRGS